MRWLLHNSVLHFFLVLTHIQVLKLRPLAFAHHAWPFSHGSETHAYWFIWEYSNNGSLELPLRIGSPTRLAPEVQAVGEAAVVKRVPCAIVHKGVTVKELVVLIILEILDWHVVADAGVVGHVVLVLLPFLCHLVPWDQSKMDLENWPINREESNGISQMKRHNNLKLKEALLSNQDGKPNIDHDPKHSN